MTNNDTFWSRNKNLILTISVVIMAMWLSALGFVYYSLPKLQEITSFDSQNGEPRTQLSTKDGWKESGLQFEFSYPEKWHVFSDGNQFVLHDQPIYRFPHQAYSAISGVIVNDYQKALAEIQSTKAKRVSLATSSTTVIAECFEDDTKEVPEGPFASLNGKIECLVSIARTGEETLVYQFTASNTNDSAIRETFRTFIASIKPL